jgi:phage terminase large subunit GpA-like protein
LTLEKQRPAPGRPGRTYWTSPSDQEPWDCLVYAYAAAQGLKLTPGGPWAAMLATPKDGAAAKQPAAKPVPIAAAQTVSQSAAPKPKATPRVTVSPFIRRG